MATYYVRMSGSDSNAGTSAGAAWRTLSKAFTTVASGDTVYIGAGTYREALTISTAWTSETKFVGDYIGVNTGDAGIVYWSAYTNGDRARGGTRPLTSSGTPRYWTFENIVFLGGTGQQCISATVRDFKFTRCVLGFPSVWGGASVELTCTADVTGAVTLESCIIQVPIRFTLPRSSSADYDVGVLLQNCQCLQAVATQSSGAGSFYGGGVTARNCEIRGGFSTSSSTLSTSIPCAAYNCFIGPANAGLNANTSGQIVEDYNVIFCSTARSNVTAGTHSISTSAAQTLAAGFEWLYDLPSQPYGMPFRASPSIYMGGTSVPSTDILGRTRTGNGAQWIDSGTATAGGAKTITDSGKSWGTDTLIGCLIMITSGTGSGQKKVIDTNTATVITVFENWSTQPDNTSVYRIIRGPHAFTATCTSGNTTTATISSAAWDTNQWAGYTLEVTAGTGSGQTTTVTSNTGTAITVPTLTTGLDNTSVIAVYRQTSVDALLPAVGCFEPRDCGTREATTVRTGTYSIRLTGPGVHDFQVPVDATSTTITVYARYDSRHGSTNKPQISVVNGGGCGVSDATSTMTSAADTWEALSLTFTPTAKGIVTIRLTSRADYPDGNAFFDS